jgi:hypothetical protein
MQKRSIKNKRVSQKEKGGQERTDFYMSQTYKKGGTWIKQHHFILDKPEAIGFLGSKSLVPFLLVAPKKTSIQHHKLLPIAVYYFHTAKKIAKRSGTII